MSSTPSLPSATDPGAILPRSASLALWLWGTDPASAAVERAIRAVVHDDEPHGLSGDVPDDVAEPTLHALLSAWCGRVVASAALFPEPGDAMGVPAEVSAPAIEAEECVLVSVSPSSGTKHQEHVESWALVPEVEAFGSVLEPGHLVHWTMTRVAPWTHRTLGTVGSLADAERALQRSLRSTTEALASLDVSRWREDAGEAIAALRSTVDLRGHLPRDLDPRRTHVFQSAARLRAIVDLATVDDGGAVNLWQADQRSTALREIDRVARRAMAAATFNAPVGAVPPAR
ncbi:hypothetical protein [Sanguibacter antarcticus]|uniref:Uncharacterized protein n=1 Tax=Sanguibacter antarcticus TaxID=372484 RepID=A0A2A9E5C6_9MICO|nr:hypothetical protein [Sanguibacter antarcticus]PFG33369.1 hypothetical protein ATL42_1242 [Sanguibacter antarcticus]